MANKVASKTPCRGVFWEVDGELLAFPLGTGNAEGLSKSGLTYNHRKLWPYVRPDGCNVGFDYYPRGRVEINSKGDPVIWMNPNVDEELVPEIKLQFGITSEPKIIIDGSKHYKCHLDDGYKPQKGGV